MQNEDFFFLGKISSLNSLKKSGSEKKKTRYAVSRCAVTGFTNNHYPQSRIIFWRLTQAKYH